MSTALPMTASVRFHLSLNVSNLERAIAFYRILFGTEPAKRRADYAKFELEDPPLVLSLEPTSRLSEKGADPLHSLGVTAELLTRRGSDPFSDSRPVGGPLNHLGFRMPDSAALVAMQQRLELAGIRSKREEGVECCYARQTKFWVTDPDQTLWEIYTLEEDIDHRGAGQSIEAMLPEAAPGTTWEHRLTDPLPDSIPCADASMAEVRLRGSFNLPLQESTKQELLKEARRVLRPGGRLFIHVLVAEKPFAGSPHLPGPAAAVQHVPVDAEPPRLAEQAGFVKLRRIKFDDKPCFVREGVAMREMQLEGFKPA